MKTRSLLTVLFLLLPMTAYPQNLLPRKDLAFAQVVAGGGFETILNVTNRGTTTYNGVLNLFHGTGQSWSPLVNGNPITDGKLNIALTKDTTAAFRITSTTGIDAGCAVIVASGLEQTNFLEGTLTYYITSGTTLTDSVGVQPSGEFYISRLPFDDFHSLALALVNANTAKANVQLTVFSNTNAQLGTFSLPLESNQYSAQYLYQLFPGVQVAAGRLEIQSDLPIFGTALTDKGGQFSSLPLLPAIKAYTFSASVSGISFSGELGFWIDGPHVQGYLRTLMVNGVPETQIDTLIVGGNFVDKVLQFYASGRPDPEQLLSYGIVNQFSPSAATQQGTVTFWLLSSLSLVGQGTVTLTAIN